MSIWEVLEDRRCPGDWRVEAINHEAGGEVYVAIFSGPTAQARAEEYAAWKIAEDVPNYMVPLDSDDL